MDIEKFRDLLCDVTAIYVKTKDYVIRAEEIDPSLRSNIAVFKEQRDGLDHIVRAFAEYLEKGDDADNELIRGEFSDAKSHLIRAAYDALDGMGISYKLRLHNAMEDISMKAICAVFPEYNDTILVVDAVQERIIQHRKNKAQRKTTIEELDSYFSSIDTIDKHYKTISTRLPAIVAWEIQDRKQARWLLVVIPIAAAIAGALVGVLVTVGIDSLKQRQSQQYDSKQKSVPTQVSASASPSP